MIWSMHAPPGPRVVPLTAPTLDRALGGRPHLLLHLGTHKTGSTALQVFFQQQRETLRTQGILYPKVGADDLSHLLFQKAVGLVHRKGETHSLTTYLQHLRQLIAETTPSLVVMSSEHFFAMPQEWVETLIDAVEPLFTAVTVVLYVRPQRELWMATYNQKAKALKVLPTQALWGTTDYLNADRVRNMFYADYLDCFARLLGREHVIVRPYRRELFPGGDIVSDFCMLLRSFTDVHPSPLAEPINPSLGWKGLAFALQLAPHHYGRASQQPAARAMRIGLLRAMREGLPDWLGSAPNYLTAAERCRVHEHYETNNARLVADYALPGTAFSSGLAEQEHRRSLEEIPAHELSLVNRFMSEAFVKHNLSKAVS